jgi:hypothetical protein
MKTEKKVRRDYVDNKKFYEEIVKYKKAVRKAKKDGLEEPRMPNYIGECIYKIAENLSLKPCFINYSFRDEMISDGVENCILYFKDYDPKIGKNPFAYFTQVIYYAFLRRISKEEKNRYIIYKNFQHTIIHGSSEGLDAISSTDDENNLLTPTIYDNINDFMCKFEKKEEIKKDKRKIMKKGISKFYDEDDSYETRNRDSVPG